MNEDRPLITHGTRIAYENPWIKVREDKIRRKDGKDGIYGYLEASDSVCIVAVNQEGEICLVETYRHPFGQWFWGVPGGGADGEDPIVASKRELEEESGVVAKKWTLLGRSRVCNGLSTEYQLNVLATDLSYGDFVQTEDETRARKFVSLAKLDAMVQNGEFEDNQGITAIYLYKCWLQKSGSFML